MNTNYALNNMKKMLKSTYSYELDRYSSDIPGQAT